MHSSSRALAAGAASAAVIALNAIVLGALAVPPPAFGRTPDGLGVVYLFKDWYVACDNTRACEAHGYHGEGETFSAVLVVPRDAGPGAMPQLRIGFGDLSAVDGSQVLPPKGPVALLAGRLRIALPAPAPNTGFVELTGEQAQVLLPLLLRADTLKLSSAGREWSVSLAGATAALLKMDDLQGRIGTPAALARPGTRAEASVPGAAPVPSVRAQRIPRNRRGDAALLPTLQRELSAAAAQECPLLARPAVPDGAELFRLSERQVLVVLPCWMAAYNGGSAAWIANDRPPHAPVMATFASERGGPAEEGVAPLTFPSFTRGDDGVLDVHSAHKGRGIGDCFSVRTWVWDGRQFALTSATESPCRLYAAGGLPMTLWRAESR